MTTDYYPLIRKAVDGLERPDARSRQAMYERALQALVRQLEANNVPDAEIGKHIEALQAACARIEDEVEIRREPRIVAAGTRPQGADLRAAHNSAPERKPQIAPAPNVRLKGGHLRAERAFDIPENPAIQKRHSWKGIVLGVALIAALLAAGTVAYLALRDRDRPIIANRAKAERPAAVKAAAPAAPTSEVAAETASYILRRQRVYYRTTHPAGTVILSVGQRFLYVVQPNQVAIRYAIAVGPQCQSVVGLFQVIEKIKEPAADAKAQFAPPALYFDSARAVHDTKEPQNIGGSSPTGCFHSLHEDVVDLYDRVPLKERVVVAN